MYIPNIRKSLSKDVEVVVVDGRYGGEWGCVAGAIR